MEYRTLDSLLIPRSSRSHSLSGVSPAMRQDFVSPCRSGFPPLFAANPAGASPSFVALRPHSPGDTSIRSALPASSAAGVRLLPWSVHLSVRSHKNSPQSTLPRAPLGPAHLALAA